MQCMVTAGITISFCSLKNLNMPWGHRKPTSMLIQLLLVLCCCIQWVPHLITGFQQEHVRTYSVPISKLKSAYFNSPRPVLIKSLSNHMALHMATARQNSRAMNKEPVVNPPINQYIKATRVRLIAPNPEGENEESENGEVNLGIIPIGDALKRAADLELDLVMINDKSEPPICKILDYGKFKYSVDKKKKENIKKQAKSDIKEVKMSYKIDQHDFDVRLRAIQKFVADGDRVKVMILFKGREMQHKDLGHGLLTKLFTPIADMAVMESAPKMEGRAMSMLVGPKKK